MFSHFNSDNKSSVSEIVCAANKRELRCSEFKQLMSRCFISNNNGDDDDDYDDDAVTLIEL
jgi:hypothetical protein